MRRLVPIAAFALFLAVPLWAQHGGGHGGGGGHAGGSGGHSSFGGGHGGGFSGARASGGGVHAFSGARSGSGSSYSGSRPSSGTFSRPFYPPQYQRGLNEEIRSQRALNQRAFSRPPVGRNGFRGGRFQTYGFRNNCYGYPCRGYYPWGYGAYYDPFWWGDSGDSYNGDYDQDSAVADDMDQQSLDEQQMRQQQMMQQEYADGDQDLYARGARPAQREAQGAPILPNTVLVFHDQHKQEIRNYAIVGQTLWSFNPQHTERIPLSDLDLAATTKANDDRGLTFRVPDTGEAQ
jgi:hypothetical protein